MVFHKCSYNKEDSLENNTGTQATRLHMQMLKRCKDGEEKVIVRLMYLVRWAR